MRNKILIVDDVEINREMLAAILEDEHEILLAEDGRVAMDILKKHHEEIALLMLDLIMPKMDGFEVLKELKDYPWSKSIGIIIISTEDAPETQEECFELGVDDFARRPYNNNLIRRRVSHVISSHQTQEELEQKVAKQTETMQKQYRLLLLQAEKLKQNHANLLDVLGTVVEYRNVESGKHIERVKEYTRILAECVMEQFPEYNLTPEKVDIIVAVSPLHDIGKIAIPDAILMKPGRLTDEEFEFMKSHTTKGAEILTSIKNIWDDEYGEIGYEICRHHHERYDGKGYPDGLKGEKIPLSAQIVAVADVYDALVNERVYKRAFSKDEAFQMIMTGECGMFSPEILDCFWKTRREFAKLAPGGEASEESEDEEG